MDKLSKFESLSDANLSTFVGGSDKNNVFFQIGKRYVAPVLYWFGKGAEGIKG